MTPARAVNTFADTGSLTTDRQSHTATLLHSGKGLVAGGEGTSGIIASAELYDPRTGTWSNLLHLAYSRYSHTATLLPTGRVLIAGGYDANSVDLSSAELFDGGLGFSPSWQPRISDATFDAGGRASPATSGTKTTALHIASNVPGSDPYDLHLTGQPLALSFTQDTDGDGMSDATEVQLAALGFDWQTSQPALVAAYYASANNAGLFTTAQVQALHVGTPLLAKDPTTGQFKLTIGVEKSTDLLDFSPFPMTAPQTLINGEGKLEFLFTPQDNAAFFRLGSR